MTSTPIEATTERYFYDGCIVSTRMSHLDHSFEILHPELCPHPCLGHLPACPIIAVTTVVCSPRIHIFKVSLDCKYTTNALSPRYLNKRTGSWVFYTIAYWVQQFKRCNLITLNSLNQNIMYKLFQCECNILISRVNYANSTMSA